MAISTLLAARAPPSSASLALLRSAQEWRDRGGATAVYIRFRQEHKKCPVASTLHTFLPSTLYVNHSEPAPPLFYHWAVTPPFGHIFLLTNSHKATRWRCACPLSNLLKQPAVPTLFLSVISRHSTLLNTHRSPALFPDCNYVQ